MIGPVQCDISGLSGLKNVFFLGRKEHRELKKYIDSFDVCLIPYKVTEYTNNSYPNKAIEYMAFGKPVVSTSLEEFKSLFRKEVYFADNYGAFSVSIENALKEDNAQLRKARIECAGANTWQKRIEDMSAVIVDEINKKIIQKDNSWKKIMRLSLRRLKVRTGKLLFTCATLYLVIFYTPVIWFLSAPLKLDEQPHKADAIVVFAGGVGESGKPEQGYEERVEKAVELFKNGYAQHLVFSSGYTYVFTEPMVMKALAVSQGVPEKAIILEDRARSTFENVKLSAGILKRENWKDIILISSPYNMRRASLVFNKNAKDIKVNYVSSNSIFYEHPLRKNRNQVTLKQINLIQIRALVHEYLGIIYYLLKGYI